MAVPDPMPPPGARSRRSALPSPDDLARRLAGLRPNRQDLLRPVLASPREHVLSSSRTLAAKLGVDPATVVRLTRDLGFVRYRDFQHYLQELAIAHATSLDTMSASKSRGTSLAAHIRESMDADQHQIQRLRHSQVEERIAALARRMHAARRLLLVGGDLATSLVVYLRYHLLLLGLPVQAATGGGESGALARAADNKDLLLAFSFRRCLRQTVEAVRQARAQGAYCVGITDTFVSPLARFAHESFLTPVDSPTYGASYAAPICLLNGIIAACGYFPSGRTRRLLVKLTQEQRSGSRWYTEPTSPLR
ncbi:MAG: MurR/RpiR family transcriptional regulator [Terriglobales bacterium]